MKKQVIIIGAGPAGLTAAWELLQRAEAYQIVILEASEEVGGLSRTVSYNGNRMDIGASRFCSEAPEINARWHALLSGRGVSSHEDGSAGEVERSDSASTAEEQVMRTHDCVSHAYCQGRFFDCPVKINRRTLKNLGLGKSAKAGFGFLGASVKKLPEDSLENFYINRMGRQLYSLFFEGYAEKLWGRHPDDISAVWGAPSMKEFSDLAVSGQDAKPCFFYPKRGVGQLWETAASKIESMGGVICRGCRVTHFDVDGGKITGVHYTDASGVSNRIGADIVISSMPLKDLMRGLPDVPEEISHIAGELSYRASVMLGLLLDRESLTVAPRGQNENPLLSDDFIYVTDPELKLSRIRVFHRLSPDTVADPTRYVWVGLEYFCDEGDDYWNMSHEAWVNLGVSELRRMGLVDSTKCVSDSHKECVKKAYPVYANTYGGLERLTAYLDTVPNLYCVGRNGQHQYRSMDEAMQTSLAAVRSILSGSTDKCGVWDLTADAERRSIASSTADFRDVTVKTIPKKEYKPPITIRISPKRPPKAGKR